MQQYSSPAQLVYSAPLLISWASTTFRLFIFNPCLQGTEPLRSSGMGQLEQAVSLCMQQLIFDSMCWLGFRHQEDHLYLGL